MQTINLSQEDHLDMQPPAIALASVALLLLAVAAGALAAVLVLPQWLPALGASLFAPDAKAYWLLARSSGFAAYGLLWLSMALGLMITNKLARLWPGGPVAYEVHQYASILGLAAALFHALILLGDVYINYTLADVLVPFASDSYRPLWVAMGQVSWYLFALVGLSFYVRRFIGRNAWRLLHGASFAVFVLALAHGLCTGSDSNSWWAASIYWASGGSLLFLTIYRVLVRRRPSPPRAPQHPAPRSTPQT